jgi:hypothetical protein
VGRVKRLWIIIFALVVAAAVFASAAAADKPTRIEFAVTGNSVLTDVCAFSVNVASTNSGTRIDYVDTSGALTRIHVHAVEQDTFTANGKTLVGIPFTFNVEFLFDSSGNVTHTFASGLVEKVPLPDGSLFVSVGRVDFVAHPGVEFILSPDKGNPGNVAGFCAALAP